MSDIITSYGFLLSSSKTPPAGYESAGQQGVYKPILAPCEHREERVSDAPCCKGRKYMYCTSWARQICFLDCQKCDSSEHTEVGVEESDIEHPAEIGTPQSVRTP